MSLDEKLIKLETMIDTVSFKNPNMYNRYYYIENKTANGIYIRSKIGNGVIHIVKKSDFPVVMDGECGVINVEFDLKNNKILSAFCNGDV